MDSLNNICEKQYHNAKLMLDIDKKQFDIYEDVISNKERIIGMNELLINTLNSEIENNRKEIKKQKLKKIVAIITGSLTTSAMTYLFFVN